MSYTNGELVKRFVRGGSDGKCNRMAIEDGPDHWTFLWGYGHALYAARKHGGPLYIYDGWYGYSQTTSSHLNRLKSAAKGAYGEPRADGDTVRVLVDGNGSGQVTQKPPTHRALIVVDDDQPGTSYGRFDAKDRPELEDLDGEYLEAPNGYGD
mgnify:CR=1 FL=1